MREPETSSVKATCLATSSSGAATTQPSPSSKPRKSGPTTHKQKLKPLRPRRLFIFFISVFNVRCWAFDVRCSKPVYPGPLAGLSFMLTSSCSKNSPCAELDISCHRSSNFHPIREITASLAKPDTTKHQLNKICYFDACRSYPNL